MRLGLKPHQTGLWMEFVHKWDFLDETPNSSLYNPQSSKSLTRTFLCRENQPLYFHLNDFDNNNNNNNNTGR